MQRRNPRRRLTTTKRGLALALLTGVAVLAAAVGIGYAAIPDGNGVYTACKLRATGTIRLIDKSLPPASLLSRCTSHEDQITWSQTGPQGIQGVQGIQGSQGPAGPQGPQGPIGPNWAVAAPLQVNSNTLSIGQGSIDTTLLANGAATSAKLSLSNTASQSSGPDPLVSVLTNLPPSAQITVPSPGPAHRVLVTGQAQISCACPAISDAGDIQWQLFDDVSGPVGPVYRGRVASAGLELAISVSFLHTAAAGPHTYTLQAMSSNTGAPVVTASNAVVTAVDFGQ